jgi:hypothetical protein
MEALTVIFICLRWYFPTDLGHKEDGAGGGGGVQVSPVGFIEITNKQANFRPIRSVSPARIIMGSIFSLLLLRARLKR